MRLKYEVFASALKAAYAKLVVTSALDKQLEEQKLGLDAKPLPISVVYGLVENLQLSYAKLGLDYETLVLPMSAAYELGQFILSASYSDLAYSLDDAVLSYFKQATDSSIAAEIAVFEFRKVLRDNGVVSDVDVIAFAKSLIDLIGAEDTKTIGISKLLEPENTYVVQLISKDLARSVYDFYSASDDTYFLSTGKNFSDSLSFVEDSTFGVGKNFFDTSLLDDGNVYFATSKQLYSHVSFTDDVDGAASLEDDQEMHFVKNTTDSFHISDSLFKEVLFSRLLQSNGSASDSEIFEIGKNLIHVTLNADIAVLHSSKILYHNAALSDERVFSVAKSSQDSANVVESRYIGFNTARLDQASVADTGLLRSQDYCDFTYFAEDYVGTSRVF